ncbi:hypothetical protein pb186bvf_002413 [Paramecium bursaria]
MFFEKFYQQLYFNNQNQQVTLLPCDSSLNSQTETQRIIQPQYDSIMYFFLSSIKNKQKIIRNSYDSSYSLVNFSLKLVQFQSIAINKCYIYFQRYKK